MTYKALIIGGGIAGPVTAMALRQAGMDPVVYEAYPRDANGVGAFLTLAVNGLDALRALDLHTLVRDKGFDTPTIALLTGGGRRLAEFPTGALPDGTVTQTIMRATLYGALRDEARCRGVPVEHGKRLVDAERTATGVVARFADGSEAEGDLLIGADGLRSVTRGLIDPAAPEARYVPLLNTGGIARGVAVDAEPGVFQMIFGRRCFFAYILHPDGAVWWFANPPQAKELSRAELAAISPEAWRARLLDLFGRDATPAVRLIEATDDIAAPWSTYDFPSVPTWHRDRMIIIGDAAHAMSPAAGQGAAMAMEDALVLAKCLRDLESIDAAFAGYERLRRERVERTVAQGKRNGDGKAPGLLLRLLLPLVFKLKRDTEDLTWMWEHHIDWESPVGV
ncbi:MAG TPA: FAD-dependent monooxygenase [Actinophytocola sp.]|uniref:FAD-dependent monooxygenase n=1 Tax=Actinophytocola sp. TaxID=1872138 RepID=UPI002DDCB6E4|nr:FAD-dependent monooxygenase [Actinophytocola sp.]HEV2779759.1 FAD-dependent monooxygenase [Actinophytocola sp.]